jgi:hypothetical protein
MHHLRPGAHYTEMPNLFEKEKDMLAKEKSLVFEGVHYLHLFYFLMTKRYDKIADNLVNINNSFSSREEAISILKQRTAKFYNRGLPDIFYFRSMVTIRDLQKEDNPALAKVVRDTLGGIWRQSS